MGIGYVPNTFQNRTGYLPLRELDQDLAYASGKVISAADFLIAGDGSDETTKIQAAITAAQALGAGTTIVFPHGATGVYSVSSQILIAGTPVYLQGTGMSMPAFGVFPATSGVTIKYIGAPLAGGVIKVRGCQSHGGIKNLTIDANNLADACLDVDTVLFGEFRTLALTNAKINGLLVQSNVALGSTCSWNRFVQLLVNTSNASVAKPACVRLTGDATTNTCHNTFEDLTLNYGGNAHGIYIGNCDNNRFMYTMMNRDGGGTGFGVECDPTEVVGFPEANIFFHLQAGSGGWHQPTNCPPNIIYSYMRDNGQPAPAMNSGEFSWINPGTAVLFGKQTKGTAANGDLDTAGAGSGLWVVRDAGAATTALVMVDMGSGLCTVVSDPGAFVAVGADPGAASSKFWVTVTGATLRVRNRFAIAKDMQVTSCTTSSTPF